MQSYWLVKRVSDGRHMGQSVSEYTDRPHIYLKEKDAQKAINYTKSRYPGYTKCIPVQVMFVEIKEC